MRHITNILEPTTSIITGLPRWCRAKESACQCKRLGFDLLSWEDPLEKGMATHPSVLVWEIPQTEEPGRVQSMGLQRNWT